jgi:hypothetical protein
VVSILVSTAGTTAATIAATEGTLPPPSTDVIVDGPEAIKVLVDRGLIIPVTRPDGTTAWIPTTPDFTSHPDVKGVAWNTNPDGSIDNPTLIMAGAPPPTDTTAATGESGEPGTAGEPGTTGTTETPPAGGTDAGGTPPPVQPTAPSSWTDPASQRGMNGVLDESQTGKDAEQWVKDHNVGVVFDSHDGSFWDQQHNRIVINPQDNQDAAQIFVHEVNHAQNNTVSNTAWNGGSKDNYVNTQIAQETDGTVHSIKSNDELRAKGFAPPHDFPLEFEYHNARDNAITTFKATHPDAPQSDADAAGDKAGWDRVKQGFDNGEVKASTNGQSYRDYYGDSYTRAHGGT